MRKLVIAAVVWILFGFIFAWSDRQTVDEKAELFRKKEALLDLAGDAGRVLIAGGSNAFWGVSSATLQELVQRPVVNISVPSEIEDPALMRALAVKLARPGDVVVYSSMSFWVTAGVDKSRALKIAKRLGVSDYTTSNLNFFDHLAYWWRPYPNEVNPATALVRTWKNEILEDPWSRDMDQHGDYQACQDIFVSPINFVEHADPARFVDEIQTFRKQLRQKGALLANVAPWILVAPSEREQWTAYYRDVIARLTPAHLPLSTGHPDLVLREDQAEFCECAWHLKRDLGLKRTRLYLKERIEQVLTVGLPDDDPNEEGDQQPMPNTESGASSEAGVDTTQA